MTKMDRNVFALPWWTTW